MVTTLAIVVSIVYFKPKPMLSDALSNSIKLEKQYFLSKVPAAQQVQEWERFCNALSSLSTAIMAKRQDGVDYDALLDITQRQEHMLQENAKKLQILILDQAFQIRVYQDFDDKTTAVERYGAALYDLCRQQ